MATLVSLAIWAFVATDAAGERFILDWNLTFEDCLDRLFDDDGVKSQGDVQFSCERMD